MHFFTHLLTWRYDAYDEHEQLTRKYFLNPYCVDKKINDETKFNPSAPQLATDRQ